MPGWLVSLLSIFAKPVIAWSLQFLEAKYPGLKPIIDQILKWLEGQAASGNVNAINTLAGHVDSFCSSTGCPPDLKHD